MYYKNIKDYDQLRCQREKCSTDNGVMLTVMLVLVIGLVTTILI